jgi:hypothetical protein
MFIKELNAEAGQFMPHLNFYCSIWNDGNHEIIQAGCVLADI